jgi:hypothetical protein
MAAVLTDFAASRGMECRLLSLNDTSELHRMTVGGRDAIAEKGDSQRRH